MKEIKTRFKKEPSIPYIDVLFSASEQDDDVNKMMEDVSSFYLNNITVFDEDKNISVIPMEDIILASVDGKQTRIRAEKGEYHCRETLKKLEKRLYVGMFIRTSRNEIVNMAKIVKYNFTPIGALSIILSDGTETWASRRCIPLIRKRLKGEE